MVTNDTVLAGRCLKAGAKVIAANGRAFTDSSIGMALAMRDLMTNVRDRGHVGGGPPAFSPRDRSAFRSALDQAIRRRQRTFQVQ